MSASREAQQKGLNTHFGSAPASSQTLIGAIDLRYFYSPLYLCTQHPSPDSPTHTQYNFYLCVVMNLKGKEEVVQSVQLISRNVAGLE